MVIPLAYLDELFNRSRRFQAIYRSSSSDIAIIGRFFGTFRLAAAFNTCENIVAVPKLHF
jgi:hypothetical protein